MQQLVIIFTLYKVILYQCVDIQDLPASKRLCPFHHSPLQVWESEVKALAVHKAHMLSPIHTNTGSSKPGAQKQGMQNYVCQDHVLPTGSAD